ncbi:hypothetical protein JCM19241_5766 [Vibrio ishigakensis]|uniref:DUF924 domain-containing protein n=1 Tax=Vibrio ishigakensis TaxID=1481914 RepID=A0A0B8QB10_9VIBR|nr:hypothetical protein JCM19241_5766 [Vibrio ishigakensis]
MQYKDVLDFWFNELEAKDWFAKNLDLDEQIRQRFDKVHQSAAQCELYSWRETPQGRLARSSCSINSQETYTETVPRPLLPTHWRWLWHSRLYN